MPSVYYDDRSGYFFTINKSFGKKDAGGTLTIVGFNNKTTQPNKGIIPKSSATISFSGFSTVNDSNINGNYYVTEIESMVNTDLTTYIKIINDSIRTIDNKQVDKSVLLGSIFNMESLIIPVDIITIGLSAFSGCTTLKYVDIQNQYLKLLLSSFNNKEES